MTVHRTAAVPRIVSSTTLIATCSLLQLLREINPAALDTRDDVQTFVSIPPPLITAMATGLGKLSIATGKQDQDLLPAWVNPDWDRLLEVKRSEGSFRSSAASEVDLPPGALFARLTGIHQERSQSYSTVQAGRDLHIELNSNAVFVNHSCDPTLEWQMDNLEVRVRRDRPLKKGETLSFFYPSTEWTFTQPFDCWCGAGEGKCCGRIEGAEKMDEAVLRRCFILMGILRSCSRSGRRSEVGMEGDEGTESNPSVVS